MECAALRAGPEPDAEVFDLLVAASAAAASLAGWEEPVDDDEFLAIPVSLVGKLPADFAPCGVRKLDKREAVVDFLKSMQDKPKSSYTTFGQVLPGMMYFVSKCEARAAHRTRAKLEKAYQNHPAFGRFMKGKSQTPIQEMIANAGLSNF